MKSKYNQESLKYVELRGKFYQCMNEYEDLLSIKEKYDRMEGQLKEKTQFSSDEIRALKQENEKIHTVFIKQLNKYNKAMLGWLIVIIPFIVFSFGQSLSKFHSIREYSNSLFSLKSELDVALFVFVGSMVLIAVLDMIQHKEKTKKFKNIIKEDEFLKSPMVVAIYLAEFIGIVLLDCLSFIPLNRLLLFYIACVVTTYILYSPYYMSAEEY